MLHHFHQLSQGRFELVLAFSFAIVASVEPDMILTQKLLWNNLDQEITPSRSGTSA
jgi:hypothetical protein